MNQPTTTKTPRKRNWLRRFVRQFALWIRRALYEEVLVLGDSHCGVFLDRRLRPAFPGRFFHVFNVGGATASGLDNPRSKTQAYAVFRDALAGTRARWVIVLLGEVDTGFVIWYRAQKYNEPVTAMLDRAVDTYAAFLQEIVGRGFRVICISAVLPTIGDGAPLGEVAEARREVTATQRQRTELTLEFNRRVASKCAGLGVAFVDLDPESMGPDGLVKPTLLGADPANHHYDRATHARMVVKQLQAVLKD